MYPLCFESARALPGNHPNPTRRPIALALTRTRAHAIQKYGEVATRAREKVFAPLHWKVETDPKDARVSDYRDTGIFNLYCCRSINFAACLRQACVFNSVGDPRLERAVASAFGVLVSFADFVPIHHVPEGFEVFGAAVLVFEVVGVFPNVTTQNRNPRFSDERIILIG